MPRKETEEQARSLRVLHGGSSRRVLSPGYHSQALGLNKGAFEFGIWEKRFPAEAQEDAEIVVPSN